MDKRKSRSLPRVSRERVEEVLVISACGYDDGEIKNDVMETIYNVAMELTEEQNNV